jgi:hypothetical protein
MPRIVNEMPAVFIVAMRYQVAPVTYTRLLVRLQPVPVSVVRGRAHRAARTWEAVLDNAACVMLHRVRFVFRLAKNILTRAN